MRFEQTPAAFALVFLAACGGSSDPAGLTDAGYDALNSGDSAGAVETFEAALDAMGAPPEDPALHQRAKLGLAFANAEVDPTQGKIDFLELADRTEMTAGDYADMAGRLKEAGEPSIAAEVVDAGKQKHPDSEALQSLLDELVALAASDPALHDKLVGLGYVND